MKELIIFRVCFLIYSRIFSFKRLAVTNTSFFSFKFDMSRKKLALSREKPVGGRMMIPTISGNICLTRDQRRSHLCQCYSADSNFLPAEGAEG